MAKKVLTMIKLQVPAGAANPAPPVGPALGQHGVNIMEFCKAFNAQTQDQAGGGTIIPVEITVFEDRSFTFITKTPPAAVLIKQAIGIDKGSGEPNREKVGTITEAQVRAIAEQKLPGPERARRRSGVEDHRGHRPLDGRGRGRLMKRGKTYREKYATIDREHNYEPREAIRLIKGLQRAKFAETVELHIRTGLNVRHADEQLRGTLALPHGLGKEVKIAVFAKGDKAREAEEAGADYVGADELAKRIEEENWTDFDVAIATPDMMPVVGKLGRVLGPQGKMPNPKVGTVTMDVAKAVEESKAGKVEYRTDRAAIVHLTLGKTDFPEEALLENYAAVIDEIVRAKPAAAKGRYLRTITLTTTMGPGIRVDPGRTRDITAAQVAESEAEAGSSLIRPYVRPRPPARATR